MEKITKRILPLLMLTAACSQGGQGDIISHLQTGEKLPEFTTWTTNMTNTGTENLKGKPSIIILFETTCPDCHAQLPEIERLHNTSGETVNVLAIARGEKAAAVTAFWKAFGYSMPVAAPGNRTIYDLFDRGSQTGVPQVYISDTEGTVIGYADWKKTITSDEILTIIENHKTHQQ